MMIFKARKMRNFFEIAAPPLNKIDSIILPTVESIYHHFDQ